MTAPGARVRGEQAGCAVVRGVRRGRLGAPLAGAIAVSFAVSIAMALAATLVGCASRGRAPADTRAPSVLLPGAGVGAAAPLKGPALFVSPRGDDSWSGLIPEPAAGRTDGPLATPHRARDLIRRMRADGALPPGPVTVYLRGGRYAMSKSLLLPAADAGPSGAALSSEISFEAYPGERPVLTGGVVVDSLTPLRDPEARSAIPASARAHVLEADLRALEITDFGTVTPTTGNRIELYFRGKLMSLARYPNEGWLRIESVPQNGPEMLNPGLDRDTSAVPRGRHYGRFTYPGDRPRAWTPRDDTWVHGYWTWDWADQYLKVERIDTRAREVWPLPPHHSYGYTAGQRFVFLNVLEELDSPGEWYLDSASSRLFFWPPEPLRPGDLVVSVMRAPLVSIDGVRDVTLRGLTLEAGRGSAVRITGSTDCRVESCLIRNFGQTAVVVEGGSDCAVTGCEIPDVGGGGISLAGGDRRSLTPSRHLARGNHIHDFAQRIRTYQAAVSVSGVGQQVVSNLIHDAPHMAVAITGNDHLLERNEVHHIAQETGDVGAFYSGRDWTERGTVIRANYFHDLLGPGLYGVMAVYLDDGASGFTVQGNLFVRAGRGVLIGGGRDNLVEHNVFVDCTPAVSVDARFLGWARSSATADGKGVMYDRLRAVEYGSEPWASRYPELARILSSEDPGLPEGNVVRGNLSHGGSWLEQDSAIPSGMLTLSDNLTGGDYRLRADPIALRSGLPGAE